MPDANNHNPQAQDPEACVAELAKAWGVRPDLRLLDSLRTARSTARPKSDSWKIPAAVTPPVTPQPLDWQPGSLWGESVRVEHIAGIWWKLRCPCGATYSASCNDTVPAERRKCDTCQFKAELSEARQQLIQQFDTNAAKVTRLHASHSIYVMWKVHRVTRQFGVYDDAFIRDEMVALCWAKISEHIGKFEDRGKGPIPWLSKVVSNTVCEHFRKTQRREKLAPTEPLLKGNSEQAPSGLLFGNYLCNDRPAKPKRPAGSGPEGQEDEAIRAKAAAWDKATGRAWQK